MSEWLDGFIVGCYAGAALSVLAHLWADRPNRDTPPERTAP